MVSSTSISTPSTGGTSERAYKSSPSKWASSGGGSISYRDSIMGSILIGESNHKGNDFAGGNIVTDESRNNSNRWSGSVSSLSRSNSDSSTALKARTVQHNQSASLSGPHLGLIGPHAQAKPATRPARSSMESSSINIKLKSNKTKLPPPPSQPLPPLPVEAGETLRELPPLVQEKPSIASLSSSKDFSESNNRMDKRYRSPSQKAMLSSALQKANTAVLLDNANNIEGAMEAYEDACILLQLAMERAGIEEDRMQLQAIHDTYRNRIGQLKQLSVHYFPDEKELPARPASPQYIDEIEDILEEELEQLEEVEEDDFYPEEDEPDLMYLDSNDQIPSEGGIRTAIVPPRRDSLFTGGGMGTVNSEVSSLHSLPRLQSSQRVRAPSPIAESSISEEALEPETGPQAAAGEEPLYATSDSSSALQYRETEGENLRNSDRVSSARGRTEPPTSWLNTIDESGGSESGDSIFDSNHWSSTKEGVFEHDLDAAVDAAYVDEDDDGRDELYSDSDDEFLVMKKSASAVMTAQETVRPAEETPNIEQEQTQEESQSETALGSRNSHNMDSFNDKDDAEDQIRHSLLGEFEFDLQTKTSLPSEPRESSSSSYSRTTWGSSVGSQKGSIMSHSHTSLDTVAEAAIPKHPSLPPPPPTIIEPTLVPLETLSSPQLSGIVSIVPSSQTDLFTNQTIDTQLTPKLSGVRSRRLSGLMGGPLTIETPPPFVTSGSPSATSISPASINQRNSRPPSLPPPAAPDKPNIDTAADLPSNQSTTGQSERTSKEIPTPTQIPTTDASESVSAGKAAPDEASLAGSQRTASPIRKISGLAKLPGLRHIPSSSSLRSKHIMGGDTADSPSTPGAFSLFPSSSTINLRSKMLYQTQPAPQTPGGMVPIIPTAQSLPLSAMPGGGLHLLESKLHSPTTPGSGNPLIPNPPLPLEPCPIEPLSRPFWLMRCLFQTLAHPRGGYISARLFVPRDVWLMKGVKIKAMDDKISVCDLISAALGKLVLVRKNDANALFEEMQSLENVLDRVQAILTKKLGNEVGATGIAALYRNESLVGDNYHDSIATRPIGSSGKSYLSWRKLRSKGSSTALSSSFGGDPSNFPMAGADRAHMTPPQRSLEGVTFSGPNAAYTSALARLFDAAQVLDQIQVDTDNLPRKISVGLQLSQRHAAEFFGFYICRFVLADVTLLLDKFLKKGTEWVGS